MLGFVLAGTVILDGGLPAAMAAHAAVDVILGFGWRKLAGRRPVAEEPIGQLESP